MAGNIIAECGYRFGACENDKGSRFFKCKISAELGKTVKVVENAKEGLEGTRVENPHKTITCKGSATILKAYVIKREQTPYVYRLVRAHSRHLLVVTLYFHRDDRQFLVMAQH
jgi:hypothetical protein